LKKRQKTLALLAVSLIVALSYVLFPGEARDGLDGPYPVDRVVDGDTIVVLMDGTEEKVRLIGVDTPESVHPDPDRNVPYGKVAAEFTRSRLLGQQVYLEYDVETRDKYGRILAYVWIGDEMFNRTLLSEGHAMLATFPPNVRYVDEFTVLQAEAREAGRGLWSVE
jgi:micrococcal nuclease